MVRWYRDLLALRRREPALGPAAAAPAPTAAGLRCSWSNASDGRPEWFALARAGWRTVVNLAPEAADIPVGSEVTAVEVVLAWRDDAVVVANEPATVRVGPTCAAVVRVSEPGLRPVRPG
jgi:hypothetical protein